VLKTEGRAGGREVKGEEDSCFSVAGQRRRRKAMRRREEERRR
jgi:hypothetical protein